MAGFIRKNLSFFIFKHASYKNVHVRILTPVSLSLPLHFFSSQTPTHLDFNVNPSVYDVLVHKHDFPCAFSSRIASKLSNMKNPERVDSMLTFFKSSGFSNTQLQKILKPDARYLCYRLEDNIKPKFKSFQEEGFSSTDISKIISSCPRILGMSLNNNIIPSLSLLKELLGSKSAVIRLVRMFPQLLTSNMEGTVVANVEFLKSIGISMDQIRIILNANPTVFCRKPDIVRECVEKAKEMGLIASSKAFVYAIPTIASMSNKAWELKLQALRDMGYSESDILSMFRMEPRVLIGSIEKMKQITEGLVASGKFDISSIAQYPVSLMYSFEKRYEPRMRILRILESRNLVEDWPTLRILSHLTDAKFCERFVGPYSDHLSDICIPSLSPIDKVKLKP